MRTWTTREVILDYPRKFREKYKKGRNSWGPSHTEEHYQDIVELDLSAMTPEEVRIAAGPSKYLLDRPLTCDECGDLVDIVVELTDTWDNRHYNQKIRLCTQCIDEMRRMLDVHFDNGGQQ